MRLFPLLLDIHVVVCGRPPDIELHRPVQIFRSPVNDTLKKAIPLIICIDKSLSLDGDSAVRLRHLQTAAGVFPAGQMPERVLVSSVRVFQKDFIKSQQMACRNQGGSAAEQIEDFQIHPPRLRDGYIQHNRRLAVGRHGTCGNAARFHTNAVACHLIADVRVILQIRVIQVVVQLQFPGPGIIGNHPRRTVYVFIFQQSGVGSAVRIHQPVHAEISVVDLLAVISAVEISFAVPLSGIHCMVAPLPHETAAHPVIAVDDLEIILQVSGAVSHGMGIFHQQKRFAPVFFKVLLDFLEGGIHSAVQVKI